MSLDAQLAATLRARRDALERECGGRGALQQRAAAALDRIAALYAGGAASAWSDPDSAAAERGEGLDAARLHYPPAAVHWNLAGLLASWRADALAALIDREAVRGAAGGPNLTLHLIATNTPLLAWSSAARALLMASASLIRLPASENAGYDAAYWTRALLTALQDADPALARLVAVRHWPSGDDPATGAALAACDAALVYGSDRTLAAVRALAPEDRLVRGFGSRVSLGVALAGARRDEAAEGFAMDIAVYDQQGCLSPQWLFVEEEPAAFADAVGRALGAATRYLPRVSAARAAAMREAAALARFTPGARVIAAPDGAWQVIGCHAPLPSLLSVPGTVQVCGYTGRDALRDALREAGGEGRLQGAALAGCALAAGGGGLPEELARIGVSYICRPGSLQRPPFWWREDGMDVLASLVSQPSGGPA